MKKIVLICTTVLVCGSLAACGNSSTKQTDSSSKSTSSKVVKKHKKHKKQNKKKQVSSESKFNESTATSSSQQSSTQQSNSDRQLSQGEINRQRGYDPNGSPLLPGQDHAAGSNPDGNPDAWVQWQLDHQNDTTFPDGTPTPGSQRTAEQNSAIENE